MVAARGCGVRNGMPLFNRYRVSVLQDEQFLETGCTTACIDLTLLNYIPKNG